MDGEGIPAMVSFLIVTEGNPFSSQKKFSSSITIKELKERLEIITAASSSSMKLELWDSEGKKCVSELSDNGALLGSYPIANSMRIIVRDPSLNQNEFLDLSKVPKFELSDELYCQRKESARSFLQEKKLGRFKEDNTMQEKPEVSVEDISHITTGSRCQVSTKGQPTRRGTVMFVGEVHFRPGHWVGVKYDEPLGKNDGSFDGKRYFECLPKYGGFVRPQDVTVGDFPEEGLEEDEI